MRQRDGGEARLPGQPIQSAIRMKKIRLEIPVMTSGMIKGAVTSPVNSIRPRNLPNRASVMPVIVPRMVAMVAETSAIFSDSINASITCRFDISETYHLVENPPQTVASREALKL